MAYSVRVRGVAAVCAVVGVLLRALLARAIYTERCVPEGGAVVEGKVVDVDLAGSGERKRRNLDLVPRGWAGGVAVSV
jgi:hypothetical protein